MSSHIVSLSVDESTDINNVAGLAIVARYGTIDSPVIHEELSVLSPMLGTTKSIDILKKVQDVINFENGNVFDLKKKLFSVTTDGAPVMLGKYADFVNLFQKELGRPLLSHSLYNS